MKGTLQIHRTSCTRHVLWCAVNRYGQVRYRYVAGVVRGRAGIINEQGLENVLESIREMSSMSGLFVCRNRYA